MIKLGLRQKEQRTQWRQTAQTENNWDHKKIQNCSVPCSHFTILQFQLTNKIIGTDLTVHESVTKKDQHGF